MFATALPLTKTTSASFPGAPEAEVGVALHGPCGTQSGQLENFRRGNSRLSIQFQFAEGKISPRNRFPLRSALRLCRGDPPEPTFLRRTRGIARPFPPALADHHRAFRAALARVGARRRRQGRFGRACRCAGLPDVHSEIDHGVMVFQKLDEATYVAGTEIQICCQLGWLGYPRSHLGLLYARKEIQHQEIDVLNLVVTEFHALISRSAQCRQGNNKGRANCAGEDTLQCYQYASSPFN